MTLSTIPRPTWKLKACPRCRGDLYIDRDSDYQTDTCLQCGYRNETRVGDLVSVKAPKKRKFEQERSRASRRVFPVMRIR